MGERGGGRGTVVVVVVLVGDLSLVMQQEFTGHASHYKQTAVA